MSQPQRLPGLEEAAIDALQGAAIEYAKIRDQRQKLNAYEVELKLKLIRLMHEHQKQTYEYEGVSIELVTVEETVKVRVKKNEDDEDETPAPKDELRVDALCRLCSAPNPEFQTTDGKFFYCEVHSANIQEGEKVKRIRDRQKAEAIAATMREPGDESENEEPQPDPLAEEGKFINTRNKRRKK